MERYYECFFNGEDINRFWGTMEAEIDGALREVCARTYCFSVDDRAMSVLGLDINDGIANREDMERVLETYEAPIPYDSDTDLCNCVYDDTLDCLVGFHEIDRETYLAFE